MPCSEEIYTKMAWTDQHKGLYICIPEEIREKITVENMTFVSLLAVLYGFLALYRVVRKAAGRRK